MFHSYRSLFSPLVSSFPLPRLRPRTCWPLLPLPEALTLKRLRNITSAPISARSLKCPAGLLHVSGSHRLIICQRGPGMQFFICMLPGCNSTFTDKTGWFHHVCSAHRQSKKWWKCELCEYDTYWKQCMRKHLFLLHELSTSDVQLALNRNCRYNATKVIKQLCYFCGNLFTCEDLRDHLTEHLKCITSLLF